MTAWDEMSDDRHATERITRRQVMLEQASFACALQGVVVDIFTLSEAVASAAIEHPEWDMDERHTRDEWANLLL